MRAGEGIMDQSWRACMKKMISPPHRSRISTGALDVARYGCGLVRNRWTPFGRVGEHPRVTDEADHRGPLTRSPKHVRFVELTGEAMSTLLAGDLSGAGKIAGVSLTEYFVTDTARWLWRYRLDQMAADPGRARWMVRQAVVGDKGLVVGHAGFHGPPDDAGMVEIGYCVAPASVARDTPEPRWSSCFAGQRPNPRSRPCGRRSAPATRHPWPRFRASASSRSESSGMRRTAANSSSRPCPAPSTRLTDCG